MPAPHAHSPPLQFEPDGQVLPQVPQLFGSVVMSTQELLQFVRPVPHVVTHAPAEQTWPELQALAHAPQLSGSLWVSVQTPSQRVPLS